MRLGSVLRCAHVEPRHVSRLRWIAKARVLRAYGVPVVPNLGYVLTDPEVDNFTYELENEDELARWIVATFGGTYAEVCSYLVEAHSDSRIYEPLRRTTGVWWSKLEPPLGRRLGWYAVTRLLKPRRIFETGIHDGLGSLVFLAALARNAEEGSDGSLVSFDVKPMTGWIVGEHPRWSKRIGDTAVTLPEALGEGPVDLFLHDSLHTYAHERMELETVFAHAPACVLMSDNSHATTALADVAREHDRAYSFFGARPRAHFYPGGGIGASAGPRSLSTP